MLIFTIVFIAVRGAGHFDCIPSDTAIAMETAMLVPSQLRHDIDTKARPRAIGDFSPVVNKKATPFFWEPSRVRLFLSRSQQSGGEITCSELFKELKGMMVLNAGVLDYLLGNPLFIPESWKGSAIFFWGTIYRGRSPDRYVRCLVHCADGWSWMWHPLIYAVGPNQPAAVCSQ